MSRRARLQRAALWLLTAFVAYGLARHVWNAVEAVAMLHRHADSVVEENTLRITTDAVLLLVWASFFHLLFACGLYLLLMRLIRLVRRMAPVYHCPGCNEPAHPERDGCDYAKLTWWDHLKLRLSPRLRREARERS